MNLQMFERVIAMMGQDFLFVQHQMMVRVKEIREESQMMLTMQQIPIITHPIRSS